MKIVLFLVTIISLLLCSYLDAETLQLTNGDKIDVTVIEESDSEYIVEHQILGKLTISKLDVVDEKKQKKEEIIQEVEQANAVKYNYLFQSDPEFTWLENLTRKIHKTGWRMHLNLSLNSSSGNTNEQSWRVGYGANKKRGYNSFKFNSTYYRRENKNSLTDNKLMLQAHNEWLDPDSKWFCYVDARYDYDQFNSWDQRFAGEIGPGYHIIDTDLTELDMLVGFGPKKEWGSDQDKIETEFSSKLSLDWKISPRQKIMADTSYKFSKKGGSSYRVLNLLKWKYLLDRELNLSLNVGLEHEYQSVVDADRKHSDLRMYTGLQLNF